MSANAACAGEQRGGDRRFLGCQDFLFDIHGRRQRRLGAQLHHALFFNAYHDLHPAQIVLVFSLGELLSLPLRKNHGHACDRK